MRWFLLHVVAGCSCGWGVLRRTTWSSSGRNILRRWVSGVSSSSPLSSFTFFLLNSCIAIHSCQCLCLRLRCSLLLLLLAFLASRSWTLLFLRSDILIALLPLNRWLNLVTANIHGRFWLLGNLVCVLLLFSWLFRLLLVRLMLRVTDFFHISICAVSALIRFQSFSISQGVQSMISRWWPRVNAGNHDDIDLIAQERVSEDHRQLGSSEWNMPALCVKGSYAFFKRQETLVDLCTFHSPLPIVTLGICRTLWSRQVNKKQLSYCLSSAIFHFYLTNCVRSGRSVVCSCTVSGSLAVTEINDIIHFLRASCWSFGEARYLNFRLAVFLYLQLLFAVKQIADFPTVNFEEAHEEFATLRCNLEHVLYSTLSSCSDCKCLSRSCLSICKQSHNALLEQVGKQVFNLVLV